METEALAPIIPIITQFNMKNTFHLRNNTNGYYFVDNTSHTLYKTVSYVPFITTLPVKFDFSIKHFCFVQSIFVYTIQGKLKRLYVRQDSVTIHFNLAEEIIALDHYKKMVVAITKSYFYYFSIGTKKILHIKHRPLTNWRWFKDFIVTFTQTEKLLMFETFQVRDSVHHIQSLQVKTVSTEKNKF
ncbi:hypothetical protein QTN25_008628 [Entamoeba marina]